MIFPQSEFVKNVLTLITGTSFAQALPLAASPILTRIYTPEDFGVLALYVSLLSIFGVIATGRYELAVVQPVDDQDALAIVLLSFLISACISTVLLVLVTVFNSEICYLLGGGDIGPWLYGLPFSVFFMGLYQTLNYWFVRRKKFKAIASANISQGVSAPLSQIGLGEVHFSGGLILGNIAGAVASSVFLSRLLYVSKKKLSDAARWRQIRKNAVEYSQFPKYSMAGALSNSAGQQMPVFLISRFFDAHAVGLFSVIMRVVSVPISLVSGGLSQVVYQKTSEMKNRNPEEIKIFLVKLFFMLIVSTLPFIVVVVYFGGDIFAFVFGEPWRTAGDLSGIMVFAVSIRFAVSPLSVVLSLKGNIRLGVAWQFLYLCTVLITLSLLHGSSLKMFLVGFAVHEILLYTVFMAFILKGAKRLVWHNE